MRVIPLLATVLCFSLAACQPAEETSEPQATAEPALVGEFNQETEAQRERRLRATFPAQQRAPADPEVVARGSALFGINCRSCHGQDLRGGDLGGPNLLRAPVVLSDVNGELIIPVVQNGRKNPGMPEMPPLALIDSDIEAIAAYIHSVVATSQGQGAPPRIDIELDIVVGDADAGREYFDQTCSGCHSVTGDLAGYATTVRTPMNVQNSWVAGRRSGAPPNPDADPDVRTVRVTVTLSDGEVVQGKLGRRDDFLISLTTDAGEYRSFTLFENTTPSVVDIEMVNPMQRHIDLLSELTDDIMHDVTAYLVTLK